MEAQSSSSALLLLLVRSCSIRQRSEDKPAPFLALLGSIFQRGFVSGLLDLVMAVAAHRLEGAVGEDHLEAVLLDFDRVEA